MAPETDTITLRFLEERLAGTSLASNPADIAMPAGTADWPEHLRKVLPRTLKPAGVLVPVIERREGLTLLLTQRSAELKHHAGQISFPGGRMEEHDSDIVTAALRETHEEIGIAPEYVTVFGSLDAMPTITGYAVTPIVGTIPAQAELTLDTTEVEHAFEVPLSFLVDRRNARAGTRHYMGRSIPVVEFHYDGHRIWGATAHIIIEFRKYLLKE